jgi:hypothetical protein
VIFRHRLSRAAGGALIVLCGATLAAQQPSVRGEVRASQGVVAAGRTFTAQAGARVMSGASSS